MLWVIKISKLFQQKFQQLIWQIKTINSSVYRCRRIICVSESIFSSEYDWPLHKPNEHPPNCQLFNYFANKLSDNGIFSFSTHYTFCAESIWKCVQCARQSQKCIRYHFMYIYLITYHTIWLWLRCRRYYFLICICNRRNRVCVSVLWWVSSVRHT